MAFMATSGTQSAAEPTAAAAPAHRVSPAFELGGVHHLALVCRDMARTVDFYTNVLGMPLVKTIELPEGWGQHFFFDCGGGDSLAFFWFPDAPADAPGIARPVERPDTGELTSAHGSMNHVAFRVAPERIEEYRERLEAAGVACSEILNHDDSYWGVARRNGPEVFVRSIYFQDPDGILLELAAWTRPLGPDDVRHAPKTAADATGPAVPDTPAAATTAASEPQVSASQGNR
jgi:catechol 2,3-dioxygenase-like lactoylglutathione lyase family enzyme